MKQNEKPAPAKKMFYREHSADNKAAMGAKYVMEKGTCSPEGDDMDFITTTDADAAIKDGWFASVEDAMLAAIEAADGKKAPE